jgi:peptidoglycan/LPS O-acetylase OafA/YrhL
MRAPSLAVVVTLAVLGVAAVVLGEGDDSPGLQGIGVLLVVAAVVVGVRARRTRR